jgi:hypothetical protein
MTESIASSAEEKIVRKDNKDSYKCYGLRKFLAIDEQVFFIQLAQKPAGKWLIAIIAMLAITPHLGYWYSASAILGAMLAVNYTKTRALILFIMTWFIALLADGLGDIDVLENISHVISQEQQSNLSPVVLAVGFLVLLFLVSACILHYVRKVPQSLLARHPLISLLTVELFLCVLGSQDFIKGELKVILWAAIFIFTTYLWFLSYAIVDQRSPNPPKQLLQMAVLRSFWSPSYLPFGKGAKYLQKHLSKTDHELGVTQLKGVKLLIWANVLHGISMLLVWIFMDQLLLPSLSEAIDLFLKGNPQSRLVNLATLILSTTRYSLNIAFWAGLFIGIARLAGYRLPRGCWRPLESRNLMEYFNRSHYYFKELLVDFFFFPTFFRYFRNHPRLRTFFATFMAAGVGNAIWHFFRDIDMIAMHGAINALNSFYSYIFYSTVLASGVGISQVRSTNQIRPVTTVSSRIYSFLTVWTFVVCMHIFSDGSRNHSLVERFSFLGSIFGVI